jgi:3-hydroxyacyl-CoA dehydrogenase/enoyl-CoA hydratase/3-hydroxybutyryl-CoA epimerase
MGYYKPPQLFENLLFFYKTLNTEGLNDYNHLLELKHIPALFRTLPPANGYVFFFSASFASSAVKKIFCFPFKGNRLGYNKIMANEINFKNWRMEKDGDGIVWLHIDKAEAGTNVLSKEVLGELDQALRAMEQEPPAGLVILSGKPNGFIAGADVKEFTKLKDSAEALELVRRGQAVFDRLEGLPFITVALIHGFCLGGGLELALACRIRVADDGPSTRLGLPEVQLGIHPGFGGTVRLPHLVGSIAAMDMMLTGRTLDARQARKIGLVDHTVPSRHLKEWGRKCVLDTALSRRRPSLKVKLTNNSFVRPVIKKFLKRQLRKKAPSAHYPAPYAIVDLWAKYADDPRTMMAEEAASISRLITGPTARNLVRVFFLREKLKSMGKTSSSDFRHVHVIGAGVMGGDIAAWCASQGMKATLQDREPKFLAPAMKRSSDFFRKKLKDPRLIRDAMDRLIPDVNGTIGLPRADVVIEAIFEDVEAKRSLFREVESRARPDALIATNTSSIPLEELSQSLERPERLVGIHFFNPVAKMNLVEVVSGSSTGEEERQRAAAFTRRIDRLPLPVKSAPGFLVNRILMSYLMEAVILVEEGFSPETVDRAALAFGMPMGPILLADTVGLDICLHVGEVISQRLGGTVPQRLREMVDKGRLGKKSGEGFYQYKGGEQIKWKVSNGKTHSLEAPDRLMFRIFNEAMACLREGVVENPDLLDAGIIFGTGFAPFRGGPMNHCQEKGADAIADRLAELEKLYGERFLPDEGWKMRSLF